MSGRGSVPASGLTYTEQNGADLGIAAHRDLMWGMGRDIWGENNFPRNISHGERCSSGRDGPDGGSQGGKKTSSSCWQQHLAPNSAHQLRGDVSAGPCSKSFRWAPRKAGAEPLHQLNACLSCPSVPGHRVNSGAFQLSKQ